jgi:tmRNA-binding protein
LLPLTVSSDNGTGVDKSPDIDRFLDVSVTNGSVDLPDALYLIQIETILFFVCHGAQVEPHFAVNKPSRRNSPLFVNKSSLSRLQRRSTRYPNLITALRACS